LNEEERHFGEALSLEVRNDGMAYELVGLHDAVHVLISTTR